jgi:hypothetical protein
MANNKQEVFRAKTIPELLLQVGLLPSYPLPGLPLSVEVRLVHIHLIPKYIKVYSQGAKRGSETGIRICRRDRKV